MCISVKMSLSGLLVFGSSGGRPKYKIVGAFIMGIL